MKFPMRLGVVAVVFLSMVCGARAQVAPTVSCDRPDGVYAPGMEAVFTIKHGEADVAPAPLTVKILRNNREVVLTESVEGDEKTHAVRFTPTADGWYVCAVTPSGGDDKKPAALTGVVFNADGFSPSAATPADFDDFWKAQKARLAAEKVVPKMEPLTEAQLQVEGDTPAHVKDIADFREAGYASFNVEIPCLDVRPVQGYYTRPNAPKTGGHPAILLLHAAGVDGEWCRAHLLAALGTAKKNNAIVLDINAHGMLNGQLQAYYTGLAKGELAGYSRQGLGGRDSFYFLGMYLRLMRAMDFLCDQPEWDGKHLICIGTSQGGGQALAAAGLDARVSAVVAVVPALCDLTGPLAGRPGGWPGVVSKNLDDEKTKKAVEVVRYFDAVNLSARSQAQTLVSVGLVDVTCPAPGVFAAYNQLAKAKRILVLPDQGHKELSNSTPALNAQYDAFVLEHTRD